MAIPLTAAATAAPSPPLPLYDRLSVSPGDEEGRVEDVAKEAGGSDAAWWLSRVIVDVLGGLCECCCCCCFPPPAARRGKGPVSKKREGELELDRRCVLPREEEGEEEEGRECPLWDMCSVQDSTDPTFD